MIPHPLFQLVAFRLGQPQAELGAAPKDVVRTDRPFPVTQIRDFPLRQSAAEPFAEILQAGCVGEHIERHRSIGASHARQRASVKE